MKKNSLREILETDPSTPLTEWRTENSILEFIKKNVDEEGRLSSSILPDLKIEERKGYRESLDDLEGLRVVITLMSKLSKICIDDDSLSKQEFYRIINEFTRVEKITDYFSKLVASIGMPADERQIAFAKDLMAKTDRRSAVKFGIAILGKLNEQSVVEDIKLLGLHDEFSGVAAAAVVRLTDDPVSELWELAKKLDGKGKAHVLEILSGFELSAEIRDWMIWEGYKNRNMDQELSVICATHGRLCEWIKGEEIDLKLYKAASDMISAILGDDGIYEMYTYSEEARTIERFIRHSKHHAKDGSDFYRLHKLKEYLSALHKNIEEYNGQGWDDDLVSNCRIEVEQLLTGRDWTEEVTELFKHKDLNVYFEAHRAANILGISKWEPIRERIKEYPDEGLIWADMLQQSKPEHFEMILDMAQQKIEREIAAKKTLEQMEEFRNEVDSFFHDEMTEYLGLQPGKGEKFILTALASKIERHRQMAIDILEEWGKEEWSPEIMEAYSSIHVK